ncbi:GNAT family N-acetyltransferase [Nocardioides gilvus]|uniref:GNAT family N-acetyltransferase n=1 Tax=Nocardioides gilvus TaxID=1735589 RepID=UPI000D74AE2C|nr:GNAT family N-acetyltransferase [Nocardioides gilvus]
MLEQVSLRDGTDAWIVDLKPSDRENLAQAFEELSPESRRQRFLTPMAHLTDTMLDHLVDDVDGVDHIALVLSAETSPGTYDPIAIARIVRYDDQPDAADLAVTVKDAWQGRGVASALLGVLVARRPVGVTRVITEVASDNDASLAMLRRLGPLETEPNGHGAYDVTIELDAAREELLQTPTVPILRPGESVAEPHRRRSDRRQRQHLQTRDLVCPWLT